jgi:hypothetical protein
MANGMIPASGRDKKRVYEAEVLSLPPLRMILGEVPVPDPASRRKTNQQMEHAPELENTVKKLIAHLKDEKR